MSSSRMPSICRAVAFDTCTVSIVLQMHHALGPPGRAGAVHPERHLVAMRVRRLRARRVALRATHPTRGHCTDAVPSARPICTDQHHDAAAGSRARLRAPAAARARRATIATSAPLSCEIVGDQLGRRQRIDQHRHEAGAHRAEDCGDILRRVVHQQQHALAARQSERDQTVADARCQLAQCRVADGARCRNTVRLSAPCPLPGCRTGCCAAL